MSATTNIGGRLETLLGNTHVILHDEELREYAVDGVMPGAIVQPATATEVVELVRLAASDKLSVIPSGSRSKINLGMPPARYAIAVDMRAIQQIAHYDAGDLTLSVDAGMPLRVLEKVLADKQQFLPLAVPCYESSTIGGTVASGIDSVLRQQYGNVRDFLIGAEFVDGKGNLCKSGGRVVKNVSGYDLHKLLVGSLCTLGIITRLNFRTFTLPQVFAGFVASFAGAANALAYYSSLHKKGLPLANIDLLDPEAVGLARQMLEKSNQAVPFDNNPAHWHVYVSYEGSEVLVQRISRELQILAREANATQAAELSATIDAQLSGVLREAFDWLRWSAPGVALFRIGLPQIVTNDIVQLHDVASSAGLRCAFFLRAASTIYLAVLAEQEHLSSIDALGKVAEELFLIVDSAKGSAVLLHAPQTLKQRINVWGAKRADFRMMERVKHAFDPQNIFSPGRFVGGL
jgi:glycolate dehydrogenase FAD-binding subunit